MFCSSQVLQFLMKKSWHCHVTCPRWHSSLLTWYQCYPLCNPSGSYYRLVFSSSQGWCVQHFLCLSSQYMPPRPLCLVEGSKWQRDSTTDKLEAIWENMSNKGLFCIVFERLCKLGEVWHLKNCILSPESGSLHKHTGM